MKGEKKGEVTYMAQSASSCFQKERKNNNIASVLVRINSSKVLLNSSHYAEIIQN